MLKISGRVLRMTSVARPNIKLMGPMSHAIAMREIQKHQPAKQERLDVLGHFAN